MNHRIELYLVIAAVTIYLIRMLPMTLIRRDIKNPLIRSFLYYVPYVTLAFMTCPSNLSSTGSKISAWAGFLTGVILAYIDGNLFRVAICSCVVVYLAEVFFC